jgi:hypothetical protein
MIRKTIFAAALAALTLTATTAYQADVATYASSALTATTAHLADIALSAITATIVATSSGFTLTWTAAPGKTYTVEACEDLSIGDWLPIPNATGLTNGSYTDSVISPSRKFYRIVVQ